MPASHVSYPALFWGGAFFAEFFEDHLKEWMTLFQFFLVYKNAALDAVADDDTSGPIEALQVRPPPPLPPTAAVAVAVLLFRWNASVPSPRHVTPRAA
jgi:hypothetical protein